MPLSGGRPHSAQSCAFPLLIALFLIVISPTRSTCSAETLVTVAAYDGVINPVAGEYLHEALACPRADKAPAGRKVAMIESVKYWFSR